MTEEPDMCEGLWIASDALDDGTYRAVLSLDGDRAWPLSSFKLKRYAMAAMWAACEAEYEAALFHQLIHQLALPRDVALHTVAEFRQTRPINQHADGFPVRFEPGVNVAGKAFLTIVVEEIPVAQLDPAALKEHALNVLEQDVVAQLDTIYRALLVNIVGVDDQRAKGAVHTLAAYRSDPPETMRGWTDPDWHPDARSEEDE